MAEEEKNTQEEMNTDVDYIQAIQELKATTVPKTELEKVQSQNRQLLDALINNQQLGQPEQDKPEEPADIKQLRMDIRKEQTNLSYVQNALKLRKAVMDQGGMDPFLPVSHDRQPDAYDRERAQAVADIFQHCIDYAEGDSAVFTNELQRLTRDYKTGR